MLCGQYIVGGIRESGDSLGHAGFCFVLMYVRKYFRIREDNSRQCHHESSASQNKLQTRFVFQMLAELREDFKSLFSSTLMHRLGGAHQGEQYV